MSQIITITKDNQDQRLDRFLNEKLSDQTRSQIKKMIKNGLILVNDQPTKVHHFLKAGDRIEIRNQKSEINKPQENLQPTSYFLQPKIIFEDPYFLVLEKPAGLLVHATEKGEINTLVDWLIKKYPAIKEVGEEKYRQGIIHRLDRDVSGIMVVAKTKRAYSHLKEQFKNRLVKKEYLALAYGHLTQEEGEIDLPIGRNKEGQFVAHPRRGKDKFQNQDRVAKTKYKVLEYIKDYTLLSIQILTGRTHQIRAHLYAIGHPILGDLIYKPKKQFFHFLRRKIKVVDPGRIFLHSTKIGFNNLKNEWVEFNSPLPQQLTNYLNEQKTK
ncbi:MAG: RluA family pseudouridine synthase [Patescibacteria group bacterium]|jgi:23S rRNA pseudouridine1911/1915/1917 synthase